VLVQVDQDPLAPDGALAATLEDGTHLSAETNEPMWDGTPVDYDWAVGLLAAGAKGERALCR
jgi:hypothetical protein